MSVRDKMFQIAQNERQGKMCKMNGDEFENQKKIWMLPLNARTHRSLCVCTWHAESCLAQLLCIFCFDSLTSPLISHKDAIIDVIKHGVQQNVRAASLNN